MTRSCIYGFVAVALCIATPAFAQEPSYVNFDDIYLQYGRDIWLGTCEACHGYGIAGAPIPMKPRQWQERVSKPKSVLYDHAINGFFGPDDTMMPARGGNADLSDDEVRAAVDYMITLANFYIDEERK